MPVHGKEWGVGPQVNKFEQVSSDVHQISVGGRRPQVLCVWGGTLPIP